MVCEAAYPDPRSLAGPRAWIRMNRLVDGSSGMFTARCTGRGYAATRGLAVARSKPRGEVHNGVEIRIRGRSPLAY